MKAWVVTINSFSYKGGEQLYNQRVLTLLSARLSDKQVGFFIESLHNLFCLSFEEQQQAVRYIKPFMAYGVRSESGRDVSCGHDPFLRAEYSEVIETKEEGGKTVVVWKSSDKIIIKSNVPLEVESRSGRIIEAQKLEVSLGSFFENSE